MRHQPLTAELLASAAFDMASTTLELAFKDGRTIQYLYVPMTIYMELISIGDKDAFYRRAIENQYQTRQVA